MRNLLKSVAYLLTVHLTALALMSVLRLLFMLAIEDQIATLFSGHVSLYGTAFVRGLWFDNVIACYVMLVPLVACAIAGVCGHFPKWLIHGVGFYFVFCYTWVFMGISANIPYFSYFTKILNSSIWNWAGETTTTLGMIFGEASYYLYMGYFFVAIVLFGYLVCRFNRYWIHVLDTSGRVSFSFRSLGGRLAVVLPLIGLCLFGIRGRTGYNPIKVSAAYFCKDPILNQLGINPIFNLLTSTLDDRRPENKVLQLLDNEEAVKKTQELLRRPGIMGISPIARRVSHGDSVKRKNVVLVLMESMSAKLMTRFGNSQKLTPHLDSLYRHGLSFCNFYSAGTHTNHAIYASLYSFPSIMKRNAMKGSVIPSYSGLPTILRENGYHTMFFMTHESQYDNMNAFFRSNGFEDVYAQEDYPAEKVANHFGVQDDYLFEYAVPVLRASAAEGRPFFATLLTITNHPPYVIPEYFHPHSSDVEWQVVEYADWSIGRFMQAVSKEPWFENTIFVFVGDHGKRIGKADCELPESYNHIPLIIYGNDVPAQERRDFAGQIDIAPTILGLLNVSYVQNNFGIDLTREQRPCAFYTADNTIAARDDKYLYVYNPDANREFCYRLENGQPLVSDFLPAHARLKAYGFPMLQTTEYLVQKRQTVNSVSE